MKTYYVIVDTETKELYEDAGLFETKEEAWLWIRDGGYGFRTPCPIELHGLYKYET